MADFKLPTGILLPKGTHIGVATVCASADPANFEDPLTFDGMRFYKLREQEQNKNLFQVSAPHQLSRSWGHVR